MKEWYPLELFGFTLVFAIPDGSDGWLWRTELTAPNTRYLQTDLFSLRIVKSRFGWTGIELVLLIFVILIKWNDNVS